MHAYKHVVTHFFTCKVECWLSNFMAPVFDRTDFMLNYEFAKSRGAIHAHGSGFAEGAAYDKMDAYLSKAGVGISQFISGMDAYIGENIELLQQGHDTPNPLVNQQDGLKLALAARIDFLSQTAVGKVYLATYESERKGVLDDLEHDLVPLMENHFAVSAMHVGVAPDQWRKPAGCRTELGYRGDKDSMLSRADVLAPEELREFKFDRERCLCERRVNSDNHIRTHSCSDYCWRKREITVPYEEGKHVVGRFGCLELFTTENGSHMAKLEVWECRMGFGHQLHFARSESDRTGGILPEPTWRITLGTLDRLARSLHYYAAELRLPNSLLFRHQWAGQVCSPTQPPYDCAGARFDVALGRE
jgi:hypothetical protein